MANDFYFSSLNNSFIKTNKSTDKVFISTLRNFGKYFYFRAEMFNDEWNIHFDDSNSINQPRNVIENFDKFHLILNTFLYTYKPKSFIIKFLDDMNEYINAFDILKLKVHEYKWSGILIFKNERNIMFLQS